MSYVEETRGSDSVRIYRSAQMLLSIEHPGELPNRDVLGALAEVEIPGYLLSGVTARVYDATGTFQSSPLTTKTKVHATAALQLDDAFAKRKFSPNHHLFFDEIIPDDMRITDIMTALRDRGFDDVTQVWPDPAGHVDKSAPVLNWFLVARRPDLPGQHGSVDLR